MVVEGEAVVGACGKHEEVVLRYFYPVAIIRKREGRRRKGRQRSKGDGREKDKEEEK